MNDQDYDDDEMEDYEEPEDNSVTEKKQKELFQFYIDKTIKKRIRMYCFQKEISIGEFIREALEKECKQKKISY